MFVHMSGWGKRGTVLWPKYALLGSWQDVGSEEVGRHLSKVQVSG